MRAALPLAALLALSSLAACAVTVPTPDLAFLEDVPAGDTVGDLGGDRGGDPGTDPGTDPGVRDDTATDPGSDPGLKDEAPVDPGEDPAPEIIVIPQNGGYPCTTNDDCVSGECRANRCTCRTADDCDPGLWCDEGETVFSYSANCLPPRLNYAGCTHYQQCASLACDPAGYCSECSSTEGTKCFGSDVCCFGTCREGCLGCAVAPPPAPILTACMSGCYDALTQFCGPDGPTPKLGPGADCQFNPSWCLSSECFPPSESNSSICACDDLTAPCPTGTACSEGRCLATP